MHVFLGTGLHDVVARRNLLAAGVPRGTIACALADGRLHVLHRGVYAIGRPDVGPWGRRRAITLACGDDALLSHRSAGEAWGLLRSRGARWEVVVRRCAAIRPAGPVQVRRIALRDEEVTMLQGVPLTTVARTLLDLAAVLPPHRLRRAVEAADDLELFDLAAVRELLHQRHGRPGAPALRALLDDLARHGGERTRSDLEALFLQLCLDHQLPRPSVNRRAGGPEIDFSWPGRDLIVEVDGWAHHRTRRAFVADRARDRAALRAGRRTARYTWDEVAGDPAGVAAEVRLLLGDE